MGNNLTTKDGNGLLSILKEMMKPDEVVKQISIKTTVTTNTNEHTIWQIFKRSGIAIFKSTKEKR